MLGKRHEIASFSSDFYRDKYRKTLRSLLISVGFAVVLISAIIYLVLFREPPKYYASTTEGQVIPLVMTGK